MTEVLHSHFPSSPTPPPTTNTNEASEQQQIQTCNSPNSVGQQGGDSDSEERELSLLALLLTICRKSLVACRTLREEKFCSMEIGVPTDVRHVAHVTFDRFNGFLGLPVEFEPEVPRRAPSASTSVFGVSTGSMQCSYDSRGNSVPTILLLMQRRLYAEGGLQAEGIFRINADNSREEFVRDQLNTGVLPDGIDVHSLAGLIKAWFRELPSGVLDPIEPEQVIQCQSEDECARLVGLLPPMEAALLDWAINLMADVVQQEHINKMNARNIAMVFAPNMSQMADPLTALMYAVQVMNFLKTLIEKTLKERQDSIIETEPAPRPEPSDENGHPSSSLPCVEKGESRDQEDPVFVSQEPVSSENAPHPIATLNDKTSGNPMSIDFSLAIPTQTETTPNGAADTTVSKYSKPPVPEDSKSKTGQSSNSNMKKVRVAGSAAKMSRGASIISRLNSTTERVEAWR
ncbi:Rho GTPase-activating protein 1 [Ranunculus cassubicifolius]